MKNKERAEATNKPFTFTEDQQRFFNYQIKSVGSSFVNIFFRKTARDFFADADMDSLVRKFCRVYAITIRRHIFVYPVSFYAIFEHDITETHDFRQTLYLN